MMLTARFAAHACTPPDPDRVDPDAGGWCCAVCQAVLVVPHSARAPLGRNRAALDHEVYRRWLEQAE